MHAIQTTRSHSVSFFQRAWDWKVLEHLISCQRHNKCHRDSRNRLSAISLDARLRYQMLLRTWVSQWRIKHTARLDLPQKMTDIWAPRSNFDLRISSNAFLVWSSHRVYSLANFVNSLGSSGRWFWDITAFKELFCSARAFWSEFCNIFPACVSWSLDPRFNNSSCSCAIVRESFRCISCSMIRQASSGSLLLRRSSFEPRSIKGFQ